MTKNKRRQDPVYVGSIMEVKSLMLSWGGVGILWLLFFYVVDFNVVTCLKLPVLELGVHI